jgi:hypothetical protein
MFHIPHPSPAIESQPDSRIEMLLTAHHDLIDPISCQHIANYVLPESPPCHPWSYDDQLGVTGIAHYNLRDHHVYDLEEHEARMDEPEGTLRGHIG